MSMLPRSTSTVLLRPSKGKIVEDGQAGLAAGARRLEASNEYIVLLDYDHFQCQPFFRSAEIGTRALTAIIVEMRELSDSWIGKTIAGV